MNGMNTTPWEKDTPIGSSLLICHAALAGGTLFSKVPEHNRHSQSFPSGIFTSGPFGQAQALRCWTGPIVAWPSKAMWLMWLFMGLFSLSLLGRLPISQQGSGMAPFLTSSVSRTELQINWRACLLAMSQAFISSRQLHMSVYLCFLMILKVVLLVCNSLLDYALLLLKKKKKKSTKMIFRILIKPIVQSQF